MSDRPTNQPTNRRSDQPTDRQIEQPTHQPTNKLTGGVRRLDFQEEVYTVCYNVPDKKLDQHLLLLGMK